MIERAALYIAVLKNNCFIKSLTPECNTYARRNTICSQKLPPGPFPRAVAPAPWMINVSPSAWGLPFVVKSNVLVKVVDDEIGVFMNALEFVLKVPLTRLRSLVVVLAPPFDCRVVKSMVVELAAVAPRTPTANAAVAKHDLKIICLLLSQISPLADILKSVLYAWRGLTAKPFRSRLTLSNRFKKSGI